MARKLKLIEILKQNGFMPTTSWAQGIICMSNDEAKRYAEVYEYSKGHYEVWVVGDGIPSTGTISYPGGTRISEAKVLQELFEKYRPTIVKTRVDHPKRLSIKKQKALYDDLAKTSINIIEVLGKSVHIKLNETILRVGHKTGIFEANPSFQFIDKKVQEFMVKVCIGLLNRRRKPGDNLYFKADKDAIKFVLKKYPETPKKYWSECFLFYLSKAPNDKLNRERVSKVYDLIKKHNG